MSTTAITGDEVLAVVREVAKAAEAYDGGITLDTTFEELDLSSLDMTEVFLRCEEIAGRELEPGELRGVERVRDLVELFQS